MKFEFSPYIAVQVKDNDKAVEFYQRVMGMEFIEIKGKDTYLKSGPIIFCFENTPESAHKAVFFEFKTDNIKESRLLLEKEGCKVTEVFSEHSIMFIDPYGMRFHIWEEK